MADKTFNRRLNIYVNEKDVGKGFKNIRREIAAANKRISSGKLTLEEYYKEVDRIGQLKGTLKNHKNNINDATKQWTKAKVEAKGLTNGIFGFGKALGGAGGFIAAGTIGVGILTEKLISGATALFHAGVEMEVLSKKAEKVFGEALPLVTAEAEKNANQIGLTISQYTDMSAAIGDLLIPMGFQRTEAAAISTQLVNLSGALSEWSGGVRTSTEVNQILSKALLGEREGLKQLGISIKDADVKARLADKGLNKLTGTMLEQAKAAATLELILEKSTDAQEAYTQNSGLSIRKIAELDAKFNELKDTLTKALIPVFSGLLDVGLRFAQEADKIGDAISRWVDPAKEAANEFENQKFAVKDLEENIVPLLSRYDELSSRTDLSVSEQKELDSIIEKVASTIPSAVTQFDEYGKALGLSTEAAKAFVKEQKALLSVKNRDALKAQRDELAKVEQQIGILNNTLNGTSGGYRDIIRENGEYFQAVAKGGKVARIEFKKLSNDRVQSYRNELKQLQQNKTGLVAYLAELSGNETDAQKGIKTPDVISPTPEEIAKRNERASELKKKREAEAKEEQKRVEKEAANKAKAEEKERQKRLKKIEEFNAEIQKLEDDQFLNALSDKQRALEENKQYYDDLINQAKELFGKQSEQEAELEYQRQDRILEIENEFALIREEQEAERAEKKKEKLQEKLENEAELLAEIEIENLDNKLIRLEDEFALLLEQANLHELDKTSITKKYNDERAKIEKAAAKQKLDNERILEKGRQDIQSARLNNIKGGIAALSQLAGENANLQKGLFLVEKGVAVADVIINLQKEIAKNSAGYAGIPGGVAIAAGLNVAAKVRSAISLATIAGTTVAGFAKEEGGYVDVTGPNGGKRYNAKYSERPRPGFLPPGPQLILANERGTEYFVPNHLLTHPVVADQVAIIEAIRTGSQMENEGFTRTSTTEDSTNNTPIQLDNRKTNELIEANMIVMNSLLERIDAGLYVLIGEDDASDIDKLITRTKEKEG